MSLSEKLGTFCTAAAACIAHTVQGAWSLKSYVTTTSRRIALHNHAADAARYEAAPPGMASLPAAALPCRVLAKGCHDHASQSIHIIVSCIPLP